MAPGADPEARKAFVEKLASLSNHFERAMVTFLDHKPFWKGATPLLSRRHAALLAQAQEPAAHTGGGGRGQPRELAGLIRNYFHHTEGRGNNCVVEPFRRGELDYFFAYPEDYSQQSIEWVDGQFDRRPHNPAFEVIYVYSQKEGSLDLNFRGSHKAIEPLQGMFAHGDPEAAELPPDPKDERVYDLNPLRQKGFDFIYRRRERHSGRDGEEAAAVIEGQERRPHHGGSRCDQRYRCGLRAARQDWKVIAASPLQRHAGGARGDRVHGRWQDRRRR